MLVAYDTLDGSIMDIANQAAGITASSALSTRASPDVVRQPAPAPGSGFLTELLDVAKASAAADKRKATWLLVGVGVGALVVGLLLGRYAVPSRKTRS